MNDKLFDIFWAVWGIVAPPAFLLIGACVGWRMARDRAVERYRRGLKKKEAKGKRAARQRAVLEGDTPRVRKARIIGPNRRGHFDSEQEE